MWDKPPIADIKINEKSFFKKEITSTDNKPTIIENEPKIVKKLQTLNYLIDQKIG